MNRKEAIQALKDLADMNVRYGCDDKWIMALHMAIEALSAPSGDLISRADAMGAVQDHFNADGFKGYDDGQRMMDRITSLPSADANRLSGEWTYLHGSIGSYMTISCPFCGKTFNDVAEWEYNYCPSCGARMKGGDTE